MADEDELLRVIAETKAEVERLLVSMEGAFEHPADIQEDEDDNLRLAYALRDLYPRLLAGLERYGHPERAKALQETWSRGESTIISDRRYVPTDEGGFVECPMWNALRDASAILRDAVNHKLAEERRERARMFAEAELQASREEAAHRRMLEMQEQDAAREGRRRAEEHEREKARRTEEREDAAIALRRQTTLAVLTSIISGVVAVLVVTVGTADKLLALWRPDPPDQNVVLHGAVERTPGDLSVDLVVRCDPAIDGVLVAAGTSTWSVTVSPLVSRPMALYCRAAGVGVRSEVVSIDIPAGGDATPARLPTLTVMSSSP